MSSNNDFKIRMRSLTHFTENLAKTSPYLVKKYTLNLAGLNSGAVVNLDSLEAGTNIILAAATVSAAGTDSSTVLRIGLDDTTTGVVSSGNAILSSAGTGTLALNSNFSSVAPFIVQSGFTKLNASAAASDTGISGTVQISLVILKQ